MVGQNIQTWCTLRWDHIEAFKRQWPCHGLPDNLHSLSCCFALNGDLVDVQAFDEQEHLLDTAEFDGPALLALTQDAFDHGDLSD